MRSKALVLVAVMVVWLSLAGDASAASCSYTGLSGGSWHTSTNWSCNEVPDSGDSVTITSTVVSVPTPATAGSLNLDGVFGGVVQFSNETTLGVTGAMTADTGRVEGPGTLTVTGAFTKSGAGQLNVTNSGAGGSAQLVLNGTGTLNGGLICVADSGDANPDLPNMHINNTFTIADGAAADPFPCTAGPRIHVNAPNGHLIKAATGTMSFGAGIDNDDTLTVQAGTLNLGGPTSPETSNGAHIANAGTTLGLNNTIPVGSGGRVGGPGTISIGHNVTLAAGAVLDPAVLTILTIGVLELNGTSTVTLPVLNVHGNGFQATLDSERPVTANALSVTSGAIRNNFALTVPAGGSFSKTTSGQFNVTNSGVQGSADLILNMDATLAEGSMCIAHDGASPSDLPNLIVNQDFTIGAGANATAFGCSGTRVTVNGPSGRLLKEGPGTTTNQGRVDVTGGTFAIPAGQTFDIANGISQSSGLTEIASGGTLQGSATLTGGVLRGSGQITGNLTNTSGTVRPGTSPGTLSVGGNYTQGAGGTLQTEVNGTTPGSQFDVLAVTGTATLDGTLAIASGFTPALSDTFKIITAASRSGQFSSVTGAQPGNGRTYVPQYDSDGVTLLVQTGPTTTPPVDPPKPPPPAPASASPKGPGPLILAGCLNAQGGVTGKSLGPARLGRTRPAQLRVLKGARLRDRKGLDRYCATGGGAFRIGYPTARLLKAVKRSLRRRLKGRVALILTSSKRFTAKGVKVGDTQAAAKRKLGRSRKVKVGVNTWYLKASRGAGLLVVVRGGKVRAVGIGDTRLQRGSKLTKRFLRAWELGT